MSVCHCHSFLPSLKFGNNAGAYQSGATFWTSLWRCPSSSFHKNWTQVEVNDSGKRSSLLQNDNNYSRKKFYSTGPVVRIHITNHFININICD
jgi:hypothetical protein